MNSASSGDSSGASGRAMLTCAMLTWVMFAGPAIAEA
jgi:hypothetical protein